MAVARASAISSIRNSLLQDIRRALQRGKLTDEGFCVAEGRHLLDEALRSPAKVELVLGSERANGVPHIEVPDSVLAAIASTETNPRVISLVRLFEWRINDLMRAPALVVVLDKLQDPGNAGAILRSAEAFGASGVVFRPGTVSPYNSKLLRGSAGSAFRVPFLTGDVALGLPVYAANPREGRAANDVDWTEPCAIAIGSEAHGVSPDVAAGATPVRIPTARVESLNAAVSASILLYEAARQRSRK